MLSASLIRSRSALGCVVGATLAATVLLSACQEEEGQLSSEDKSRTAGEKYGRTIKQTVGKAASVAQLEELCGQAIINGKIVDPRTGRRTAKGDLKVPAFVAGCKDAVRAK
jgi:hypothetical protein